MVYISWCHLWICYSARCVHFIVPSGRRGTLHYSSWGHRFTNLINVVELEKNTNKEFTKKEVMALWNSNLLLVSMNVSQQSFPNKILKTSSYSWGCMTFDFTTHNWLQVTLYLMPMKTKNLSAKTTKYIPKRWERSAKRMSNLNFIRLMKNSSFS